MHNFVILSPNLVFQESILVQISQATILFNYISPKQSQILQKLQNRPEVLKILACKRRGRILTQSLKKTLVEELGDALVAGMEVERSEE